MSAWDRLTRKQAAYGRSLFGSMDRGTDQPYYDGYETRDESDYDFLRRRAREKAAKRPKRQPTIDYRQRGTQSSEVLMGVARRAEAGDAEAQYKLGMSYLRGDGVEKDLVEAARWFQRAAEGGYEPARRYLPRGSTRRRKTN